MCIRDSGKIVQLDYQLKNGDIVDILTSKETYGPKRDWLKLAKTGEARNKIKQWFKKECREENIMRGREELERELKANELYDIFHQEEVQSVVLRKYSFKTLDEMYAGIGYGGITVTRILNRVREDVYKRQRFLCGIFLYSCGRWHLL